MPSPTLVIDITSQNGSRSKLRSESASTSVMNERAPPGNGEHLKHPVEASRQFSMGDGFLPVPAKSVDKIFSGQFIDMAELLRDNIKVG